jgi:hypothetical protein
MSENIGRVAALFSVEREQGPHDTYVSYGFMDQYIGVILISSEFTAIIVHLIHSC